MLSEDELDRVAGVGAWAAQKRHHVLDLGIGWREHRLEACDYGQQVVQRELRERGENPDHWEVVVAPTDQTQTTTFSVRVRYLSAVERLARLGGEPC